MAWIALIALVALLAYVPKWTSARKQKLLEQQAEGFVSAALGAGRFEPVQVSAILKRGEEGYYQEQATLYEPRAVRHHSGAGTSVRIMKGISVRSSRGRAFSTQEWQRLDLGRLIVTNKRIIFEGATEHRSLDVAKLDGATIFADGIRLSSSSQKKPVSFAVPNPWLLAGILGILQDPSRYFSD